VLERLVVEVGFLDLRQECLERRKLQQALDIGKWLEAAESFKV
jgi:hypothetical protein